MVRVLLIDENEKEVALLRKYIKKITSFEVSIVNAVSFLEAKLLTESFDFNVLISELFFKDMSTNEVVDTLYTDFKNLPLIIITDHLELTHYLDLRLSADVIEKKSITPLILEKSLQLAQQKFNFRNEKKRLLKEIDEKKNRISRTDSQIQELAYTLSHDLRGPLSSILGLSDLIESNIQNIDEVKVFNQLIHNSAFQLNELLKQLLEILLTSQNIYQNIQALDIGKEVEHVLEKIKELYPNVTFRIDVDFDVNRFEYSQNAIHFLLFNLLSNAIKFRSLRRPLIIKLQSHLEAGEIFCITVRDNGSGMDMEIVQSRIFKIFKRFHPDVEGKGLGLYAVKTMLDELGGKLEVNSSPNEGTEFRAYLKPF